MIIHNFRDILEHDMDMLILEEFSCSAEFSKIFLSKIGITNAILLSTWQSKTDSELGESDLTIVFSHNDKKIALLIEDKIDAIAMPEQPSRYILRGNKGVESGDYDYYYIFIVAPKKYLEINEKAKEYPYNVSYEEIRDYFVKIDDPRKGFKIAQIDLAIEKQKNGYQVVKNSIITDFWRYYIEYKKLFYPKLNLVISSDIKPTSGYWTYFRTNNSYSCIYFKSNKGYVDLTFNGKADIIDKIKSFLSNAIGNYYEQGYTVVKTGKSCVIRLTVPIVDFSKPFDIQIDLVKQSFDAVEKLFELSNKLDYYGISSII